MIRLAAGLATLLAAFQALAADPLVVPFHRQEKNGCGAASVSMVLDYWSRGGPEASFVAPDPKQVYRQLYRPEMRGIRLADMRDYLTDLRFRVFTLRAQWPDMEEQIARSRPLIAGLRKKPSAAMHFVVVTGVDSGHVWLNDPTRKKPTRLDRREFERRWVQAGRWLLLAVP